MTNFVPVNKSLLKGNEKRYLQERSPYVGDMDKTRIDAVRPLERKFE